MRTIQLAVLACLLCLTSLAGGQVDPVAAINRAAAAFQAGLGQGLEVRYTGQGKFSGNILEMTLTNSGSQPLSVEMPAGMVLLPGNQSTQRMIVESVGDGGPVVVPPGQSVTVMVRGYCLDSDKLPPAEGKTEEFSVAGEAGPYREAILTVLAGLRLSQSGGYGDEFLPLLQRTIVVQRALWAQEPDPYTEENLYMELQKELANTRMAQAGHAPGDPQELARAIWRDVLLTLEEVRR